MMKKIVAVSLLFNFSLVCGMGSKLRALGSKLPVVSALAAAQLYKEYDDRNEEFKKGPIKLAVEDNREHTISFPAAIRKPLYSSTSKIPTDYIEGRVRERLEGKIPSDLNVHVLRSNGEIITAQSKDAWFPSLTSSTIVPMRGDAYALISLGNDAFVGIPSYEESKFVIEHEISHIERAFFAKFNKLYRDNGQLLHIPLAIDACLIVAGLRKTVALGAIALAHSFHEQMSNLISRYMEQDADDHVPDTKEFLEDGIRFFSKEDKNRMQLYQIIVKNRGKADTFLSLCQLLDQFPLCEDKKWGYSLWQIIEIDPNHPPVNIRLEKFKKRLDKLNEAKEEEIEDLWMVD